VITADRFRALALALAGALEVPHMERRAFRTKKRIFATLAPDGRSANLMLEAHVQQDICEARGEVFRPVPGGWGRMGATTVDLLAVDESDLRRALIEAHARAAPKPPTPGAATKKSAPKGRATKPAGRARR
jgi:hypothetical protein